MDRFIGPGTVEDVRREGRVPLTADDIRVCGADIRRGDVVLFAFGYAGRFGKPGYDEHPYLTGDAAELLVERGARIVGTDTITPDLPSAARGADFDFPVHRTLLGNDVLIIENLGAGLEQLLGQRVDVFAAPLAIRGGDGGPVRVFARPA